MKATEKVRWCCSEARGGERHVHPAIHDRLVLLLSQERAPPRTREKVRLIRSWQIPCPPPCKYSGVKLTFVLLVPFQAKAAAAPEATDLTSSTFSH